MSTVKVLIVDDDDVDRERLTRMLTAQNQDFYTEEADSVESALEALDQTSFDCILLDYRLGTYTGLDALRLIKARQQTFCAVIMITGLGDESVAADAMRKGATDYLIKGKLERSQLLRSISNAMARVELERRLHDMAHYDSLTHLAARSLVTDRLQQAINNASRHSTLAALAFMDLDNFKPVNDTWGHAIGDAVLIEVAQRLKTCTRAGDTIGRFGGDEFVIVLTEINTLEECEEIASRILKAISEPYFISSEITVNVTASIGVSLIENESVDADLLLRRADQTMYGAKISGRNKVLFFDPHAESALHSRKKILDDIMQGLARNEFELYFQPQIELKTHRLVGFEALLRWNHPQAGLLLPDVFLTPHVQEKLGPQIGDWVLKSAIKQLQEWQEMQVNTRLSVNISANHLQQKSFSSKLAEFLFDAPEVDPACLELEILESVEPEDFDALKNVIKDCHRLGVTIALDDFGTGYSSLNIVRSLAIDVLKIDRSFIINMLENTDDRSIVTVIIDLCRTFNRQVVAEGIESAAHIASLNAMGCHLGQGYGIARPLPVAEVKQWINAYNSEFGVSSPRH